MPQPRRPQLHLLSEQLPPAARPPGLTPVEQLPPQQRTVIVLRIWNGLSFREISEVVGTTESTARSNMHRGLQTMRSYLEPRL